MSYWEHPKLKAPLVDVYELTNLLRQLDFKVVSLLDLTEYEMCNAVDEFLLLLDKGVYGKIIVILIFIIIRHSYYTQNKSWK
jgi:mucosa-associated lymphoid tissue lymphoma translocation protein 1